MTTSRRNLWTGIAVVACVQTAVLGWMIWDRVKLLAYGREIELEVVPVDPRSLFRGDYVILNYGLSRLELPQGETTLDRGDTVHVTLRQGAVGAWEVAGVSAAAPDNTPAGDVVLKGRIRYASRPAGAAPTANVSYGIESFFVPEGTGRDLEKLVREKKLSALIAVDADGNAGIKGLIVDGKRVYEEPLL
jgi:uncharacterized membrane-anchored protein